MKRNLLVAVVGLLLSQQLVAQPPTPLSSEARAAFRDAVEDYQMFVVPHCAPDDVRAYVTAKADRDRAFVRSLRKTQFEIDYNKAVADRADRDNRTVYECSLAPPPPPPLPGIDLKRPTSALIEPRKGDTLTEHFVEGDRQFETMVRIRDAAIHSEN